MKTFLIITTVLGFYGRALATPSPTPTAIPIPTPVKSLLDPCKMQTMSQDHADWKLKNCK